MSLIERTIYLEALVAEVTEKVKPIKKQFEKLQEVKDLLQSQVAERVAALQAKINTATLKGNSVLVATLTDTQKEVEEDAQTRLASAVEGIVKGVEESLKGIINEVDGVSGNVNVSEDNVSVSIYPDLSNKTTDFVKGTIEDPTTLVQVSTLVTGTSVSGGPVTGVGTQLAPIVTT